MTDTWIKIYPSDEDSARAAGHYNWINDTGHLALPELLRRDGHQLTFTRIDGRHPTPLDLPYVGRALARFHAAAQQHLGGVSAGQPHHTRHGITIPAFTYRRQQRLLELIAAPWRSTWLTPGRVQTWMDHAARRPAAVYKDANVRNFLITHTRTIAIDFDTLTLAPLGYDLAKLVVSAAMTYGPLPAALPHRTLAEYNAILSAFGLPGCTTEEFDTWTEVHHILTSPYQGTNGYRYTWSTVR